MTLEEKVGQLFIAYFDGEEVNGNAERLIREVKIGGIIYYGWSNGLHDPDQVRVLSNGLQSLASRYVGIPLFLAIDQEGGVTARLQKGFTEFPGNAALGRTEMPELAHRASLAMGLEMKSVGVNFNLAPVVDVNNNPANPIIGIRSFGDDPEEVASFGKASVCGYMDAGVIPCLKHFPGHGDVSVDSHVALPVVDSTLAELHEVELVPFKKLLDGAPAVMAAHLLISRIDPENCVTLSPEFLQDILREELKFEGVIVTDSLVMQGVLEGRESLEEVVINAFEAGNDILLIGGRDLDKQLSGEANIDEVIGLYRAMLGAVKSGRISEERVDASVKRILRLKENAGLLCVTPYRENGLEVLQCKEHLELAMDIAVRSVSVKECSWDLTESKIAVVIPDILEKVVRQTDLIKMGEMMIVPLTPSSEEVQRTLAETGRFTHVVFCSYNAWKIPGQLELLTKISQVKPTACIAARDPYDLDADHAAVVKIATYSPTAVSLQAAVEILKKNTSGER